MTGTLSFAPGVQLITPPTAGGSRILGTLEFIARTLGVGLLITSGTEGHPSTDSHARGHAFDLGTIMLSVILVLTIYTLVTALLGPAFYVQLEGPSPTPRDPAFLPIYVHNPGATAEHMHLQVRLGTMYP